MELLWILYRLKTKNFLLILVCLLYCLYLSDAGPVVKKKIESLAIANVSSEDGSRVKDSLHKNSHNMTGNARSHKQKHNKNPKQTKVGLVNNTVKQDEVAEPGPLKFDRPEAHDDDDVGKLPLVMAIPGPPQLDDSRRSPVSVKQVENLDQGQGVAVGVGGINRELSTTTKSHQAYHKGPDNSLDVGAADRNDFVRNKSQINVAGKKHEPSDHGVGGDGDPLSLNPAMQQPPPQPREPPVDKFRDKQQSHLGPMKPHKDVVLPEDDVPQASLKQPVVIDIPERDIQEPAVQQIHQREVVKSPADSHEKNEVLKYEDHHAEDKVVAPKKLADINPPDHIEGFRMENDGHLNRDYKKEIFLGHHDEFEWSDEEKVSGRLKVIFRRADKNDDSFLEANEIQEWIMMNIRVHLEDAVKDNTRVFTHLDADKDGYVSWYEFYSHFLVAKGYVRSAKYVKPNITLEIDDNERLLRYRYRWTEADDKSRDDKLDIDEMMNFRHPEQSERMILQLIKDMLDNVDKDGDGIITEAEFVALPHDEDWGEPLPGEQDWQEERRKEFQDVIDLNKDGKVNADELKIYFDPHNINHARLEAQNLIRMADANNDNKLSLDEVLDNPDLFTGSKMVDAKRKLHDEF